jgi:anti-sigma-K factor RskA
MSATPIAADHTEEFEQLAGLSALRVLDDDEQERFERHAAQCARCSMIVRLDRETLGNLSLAAPEMEPSPDFKRRLMDRAAAELAGQPAVVSGAPADAASADISSIETVPGDAEPESETETSAQPIELRPRPANVVPFWRRQMWATSIAALLVLGIFSYAGYTAFMNQVVATYTTGAGPASMTVTVHRSGQTELQMQGVADPPPGFVYEAWVIPPGKAPVAAGVTPSGEATLPLPSGVQGSTVAVTLERGPTGASAPTSQPLMAVVLT